MNRPDTPPSPLFTARHGWRLAGAAAAWAGYLFLLLPSLVVIPISFGGAQELSFPPKEFSLALFRQFLGDPAWWGSALQSLLVACCVTVLSLLIALPASYALARGHFRGRRVLELVSLAPMLVPVVVLGLGMYMHLSALRMVNTTLGVVLAHTVATIPFMLVALGAGLRHADPALETAAMIMGAGRLRIFTEVVVPQIRPSILVGALFAFLISFDEVIIAYFITGPETTTLPVKMYSAIRWEVSPVLAAVSTLLTILSLVVCLAIMALQPPRRQQPD
ncbi:ABC transporter permease [Bordetella genomosp. 11]|uniref:Spermidine/putrescine ABC transporter permease n=1 Tax=Bordetella genomosp. 11 TaxID=1416808 RepID=A0A261UXE2_9BORD|nr:ABC transporter permease [Bordetella genomosp. 11]OZI66554.1 spermidine/putrescine ABC transporter permease [Bordetella genomosp. 11]